MDITEIKDSVKKYCEIYPYKFYKQILETNFDTPVRKITNKNPHISEAVRIHLIYDSTYKLCLSSKKPTNADTTYMKYRLTYNQLYNVISQIYAIEKDIPFYRATNEIKQIEKQLRKKDDIYILYVLFVKKSDKVDSNIYETNDHIYEISGIFLSKESMKIMRYQLLDRINDLNKNTSSLDNFELYRKTISSMDKLERDMYMIFSGMILYIIGIRLTEDIDVLVMAHNKDKTILPSIFEKFKSDSISHFVLLNDDNWHTKTQIYEYQKEWLTKILPRLGNAEDIFDAFTNPHHHFYYMGVKYISLKIVIKKILSRASVSSFGDILMLKKIAKIQLKDQLCIPNMNIRQGKVTVYTKHVINNIFKKTIDKMKEWYNLAYDMSDLYKLIPKCTEIDSNIYKGDVYYDKNTNALSRYHRIVKKQIIKKYASDTTYILDIGVGRLSDIPVYKSLKIGNIHGIEPSIDSIKIGYKSLSLTDAEGLQIINGRGDELWENNNTYNKIKNVRYDCIFLNFTIHYMIDKIHILMKNITDHSKSGTRVVIFYLDGNEIRKKMRKNKWEIRNKQEPIYGIYEYDRNKILVYMKGIYGIRNGSIENIVYPKFIKYIFSKHGFTQILDENMYDYGDKKFNDERLQEISKIHKVLVFEKN